MDNILDPSRHVDLGISTQKSPSKVKFSDDLNGDVSFSFKLIFFYLFRIVFVYFCSHSEKLPGTDVLACTSFSHTLEPISQIFGNVIFCVFPGASLSLTTYTIYIRPNVSLAKFLIVYGL